MDPAALAAAPRLAPDILYPEQIGHEGQPDLGDGMYAWHLLAEGDSWFTIGAVPSSNLLYELRFPRWTQVLNLAYPGDTLRHIGDIAGNGDLRKWLAKPGFASPFTALLLSGGGNDLIDAASELISPTPLEGQDPKRPESYLHGAGVTALVETVQDGLRRIIALRDSEGSKSRGAPAFVHTYDYATPRNAPARFLSGPAVSGPWLYRALQPTGLDIALQQRIADVLVDRLAEGLWALDSTRGMAGLQLPAFHVVETRNTLVRANPAELGSSNDWLNEIHPTMDGYRKVAAQISAHVGRLLD